jgi:hypothetical protein
MFCGRNNHSCEDIKRLQRSSYSFPATLYDCDILTELPLKTNPMTGSSEGVLNIKYISGGLNYGVDILPIKNARLFGSLFQQYYISVEIIDRILGTQIPIIWALSS